MFSKWTGVAEKKINQIFQRASRKRPCLIFIDELEGFMKNRASQGESESSNRVKQEILQLTSSDLYQLPGIFVICGTNHPEIVDDGFADRIDRTLLLRLPTQENKYRFFQQYLQEEGMTTTVTKKEFNSVESERFSYRDLRSWIRAALEDGPWLRNENCKHFKYVKQENQSDYIIGCDCSGSEENQCRMIPKKKRNRFPAEMYKYPPLTFQDLLTARGTRAPTASQKRIEDFEEFLKNRKKKEETDDEPKELDK